MIDLITLTKAHPTEDEIQNIVQCASLKECAKGGKIYYETTQQQKNKDSVYIHIGASGKLKLEVSLHKYYEQTKVGTYTNYGVFTMEQALQTISMVLERKGITPDNLKVCSVEIGLNLYVSKDCREYMDRATTIGIRTNVKPIYSNPRYKDERAHTTVFHRDARKYYKMYDKCFEAMDKRRKDIPDRHILRIETVLQRLERMTYEKFFTIKNLHKLRDIFFREWRTLQFERNILTPRGFTLNRINLCQELVKSDPQSVLNRAKSRLEDSSISKKQYRTIRDFVENEWNDIKSSISEVQSAEEEEFKKLLETAKILHKKSAQTCTF